MKDQQDSKALDGMVREKTFYPTQNLDILQSLKDVENDVSLLLKEETNKHHAVKWYMVLEARYTKMEEQDFWVTMDRSHHSETILCVHEDEIPSHMAEAMQQIHQQAEEFHSRGSGWSLEQVVKVDVHTAAFVPLQGSSYIATPKELASKKAIVNVQNHHDEKCILWSILAAIRPTERDKDRLWKYRPYENELNMDGVSFPTPLKDIDKIEAQNNMSINVFGYDTKDKVYPLRISGDTKDQHVNLLLIKEVLPNGETNQHYCLIRNFSRLMGKRTNYEHKQYYCYNCLHGFIREDLLKDHRELCSKKRAQRFDFPKDGETTKFKNIRNQLNVPFVVYCDFECCTSQIQTCQNQPAPSTEAYQHHEPSGFCFLSVCDNPIFNQPPVVYRGDNAVDKFFDALMKEEWRIRKILKDPKAMVMTQEDQVNFQQAGQCHICHQPLQLDRVRDHDHLTGKYRGAAHNTCNLNFKYEKLNEKIKDSFIIPVVFHNLRGYDGHLLMQSLGKYQNRRLSCIPNNSQRYTSFSTGCLRFIDSCQFMSASLEKLVSNLADEGKEKFKHLLTHEPDPKRHELLLRKGVYPYDYMDSPAKFDETKLPPPEDFYSILNEEAISAEDYAHAEKVWEAFQCATLGDYHDAYLKSDVLLLADVFENFRAVSMETYGLDPAHYYTAPGLAWDSMLRITGVELELLTDPDMYLMIENGIRGGVSMIAKKHAEANNPYVEGYDASQPKKYLVYYDANNLYGCAMSQMLPTGDFKWLSQDEINAFDIKQVEEDGNVGYVIEADIEYPAELHDLHSDLPVAPERKTVQVDEQSAYTQHLSRKLKLTGKSQEKLVPTLLNKKKYVVHSANLKYYMQLGLKLTKIHRVVSFRQEDFLREYISLNTEKRKKARNSFEKDFYKLMNNAVFGKTMENVRNRINFQLVNDKKQMKRIVAKPNYHKSHIFTKDLVGVQCLKSQVTLDKPIYVGFAILELSKIIMYRYHYQMKEIYGDRLKLCFTDTDSLLYEVETDDIYKDMQENLDWYDTSDYPVDHPLHSNVNKKVLGKMKDEMAGEPIEEFVGLRSKMYSIKSGGVEKKTAKGIRKNTIRRSLRHQMYKDVLFEEKVTEATMRAIRSVNHQLYSVKIKKLALSPFDDKRFVCDNKVDTRAHGHYANA